MVHHPNILEQSNIARQGMATALINILVSVILSGVKIVSGLLGSSYALLADGIESLLDIFSSSIVWSGLKIGALPPDHNHPFGHGRAESLAAMIVSIVLIGVAIGIAVQSVREILTPHHAPAMFTLWVLGIVVLIKEGMFRFMGRVADDIGSLSVKADAWHSRSDALTSLAAFIGISIALILGKGYESADDWAALFASGVIFFNGAKIFKRAVGDLMDTVLPNEITERIKAQAQGVPGVVLIEKCRVRKSGLSLFVEIHIMVDGTISVKDGHSIAHEVKGILCASNKSIIDVLTHVEPMNG